MVTKGEELLAEFRRQRRAGDPRLSEEGKAILLRITMGDLADEFADSLAAISEADPLLGGGPDDADLLHAFRFLDQCFLVLRLEQGEEVVVDLRVALQPLQAELDGRHLTVLLEELAHLTVEDLLATAQQGNLGVDLAPHLAAHLP